MMSIGIVYLIAFFQGLMIVLFPAAATMLTHKSYHNLSPSEYGTLFVPLIVGILLMGIKAHEFNLRRLLSLGLLGQLISLLLFLATLSLQGAHVFTFFVLLLSLLFLGLGYGAGLTAVNAYIPHFFSKRTATAMSALYTLSGFGSAVAPLFFHFFFAKGYWWQAPLILSISAVILLAGTFFLPPVWLEEKEKIKKGILFFGLLAILFLYGFLETTFANWGMIYLHRGKDFSFQGASIALGLFWGAVVLGRLMIVFLTLIIPFQTIFSLLPWMIALSFLLIPETYSFAYLLGLFSFAGLACSGCLPLGFALGEKCYPNGMTSVSASLLSAYMVGYGVSSYGVGLLHQLGLSFSKIYHLSVIPALLMGFLLIALFGNSLQFINHPKDD